MWWRVCNQPGLQRLVYFGGIYLLKVVDETKGGWFRGSVLSLCQLTLFCSNNFPTKEPRDLGGYGSSYIIMLEHLCFTLRSWLHKMSTQIIILSPGLENHHTLKCCSGNFPYTAICSGYMEKYRTQISMYHCSPIQGTRY